MLKIKKDYQFYCTDESIYELNKVKPIKQHKTSWIIPRDESKDYLPYTHLCSGIRSLLKTGWVVSNFADVTIDITGKDDIYVEWPKHYLNTEKDEISFFNPDQFTDYIPTLNGTHKVLLKLDTPWRFKCPDGWGLLFNPLQYHGDQSYYSSTGLLDPQVNNQINPIMFIHPREGEDKIFIPANTPLVHLLPVPLHYDQASYRKPSDKEMKWEKVRKKFRDTRFLPHPKKVKEIYRRFFDV